MKNALSIGLCLLTKLICTGNKSNIKWHSKDFIAIGKIQSPERMPEVKENVLFSGKKNEILKLSNINGTLLQ
jgi:Fe(3+) dicitrate transport protein